MNSLLKPRELKPTSSRKLLAIRQISLPLDVLNVVCDHAFINQKKYYDVVRAKKDRALYDLMRTFAFGAVSKWSLAYDQTVYELNCELKHGKYYWALRYNLLVNELKREREREREIYDPDDHGYYFDAEDGRLSYYDRHN
uniref:Uncharacterized protein n=1 Tax=viral metagenome TaxID=1070528 RepID=A0A6C0LDS1_9ZZZZ